MNFSGLSLRTAIVVQATVNGKCCLLVLTWMNTVKRKIHDPGETHQISRYQIRCSWISLGTAEVTSRLHSGLKVKQLLYIIVQPIKFIGSGVMEFFARISFTSAKICIYSSPKVNLLIRLWNVGSMPNGLRGVPHFLPCSHKRLWRPKANYMRFCGNVCVLDYGDCTHYTTQHTKHHDDVTSNQR